jgi:hypothetical protein
MPKRRRFLDSCALSLVQAAGTLHHILDDISIAAGGVRHGCMPRQLIVQDATEQSLTRVRGDLADA